ncbi:MAG: hypothetical protein ACKOEW_08690 [Methylocystis sp.]
MSPVSDLLPLAGTGDFWLIGFVALMGCFASVSGAFTGLAGAFAVAGVFGEGAGAAFSEAGALDLLIGAFVA